MTGQSGEEETPDERYSALFAVCEEAVAAGQSADTALPAGLPSELRARLERDLACLHRLRQVLHPSDVSTLDAGGPSSATDESPTALPWTRLGRFRVRRELGRGGFGIVYLAYDPPLGREVALKVARAEVAITAELRERFRREARAASGLDHPNIVQVYEVGEVGPVCFIVSAYCHGITLAQWLRAQIESVPIRAAVEFLAILADAVQHAHGRGVIHRDLKPTNIMLVRGGAPGGAPDAGEDRISSDGGVRSSALTECHPKITDFGLAKLLPGGEQTLVLGDETRTGVILGTPSYMAPEQAGGKSRRAGPPADTYALGAILYQLLTGRPPFQGETDLDTIKQLQSDEPVPPSRLRPRVPRDVETVCLKCLEKEPHRRYATAGDLAADLRRILTGHAIVGRRTQSWERAARWCRRRPAAAAVIGLLLAVVVATPVVSILFARQEHQAAIRIADEQGHTAAALRESRRLAAALAFERGLILCEQGEIGRGMLWLVHSLELAPDEATELRSVIRVNLGAWRNQLRTLQQVWNGPDLAQPVGFRPDGRVVVTAFQDGSVRLWDIESGEPIGRAMKHTAPVRTLAFSRDGQLLATGDRDGTVRVWSADSGDPVSPALEHPAAITATAFHPDGQVLFTGCEDGLCRFWNTAGGSAGQPLRHDAGIVAACYSPDGKRILTASKDRTARLWASAGHAPLGDVMQHTDAVRIAVFSPNGRVIVTSCVDSSVRCWDPDTGKLLGTPKSLGNPLWQRPRA